MTITLTYRDYLFGTGVPERTQLEGKEAARIIKDQLGLLWD